MRANPQSELHRLGKMFGVLVVEKDGVWQTAEGVTFIAAFSAQLDGRYDHEGFVPPVFEMKTPPIGTSKEESRRLQRLLFAQYHLQNGKGEQKNLIEIFQNEQPILSPEEWFNKGEGLKVKGEGLKVKGEGDSSTLPPSGAGECCAPKLLQYAFQHGLKPLALAEFWGVTEGRTVLRAVFRAMRTYLAIYDAGLRSGETRPREPYGGLVPAD